MHLKISSERIKPASNKRPASSFFPYLLVLPTLFFVALFTVWPTISSIVKSLFRQRLNIAKFREPVFSGLANYVSLFQDSTFYRVLLNTGFYMIFYLAGLQSLPQEVYEAAKIDGAGWLRTIFSITLPLLRRSTLFITTIAFIGAFQTVDHCILEISGVIHR